MLAVLTAQLPKEDATVWTVCDGSQIRIHTTFRTDPAEILREAGVRLQKSDRYAVLGGNCIRVIRIRQKDEILQQEQCYARMLPYDTVICGAPDLPEGTEKVLREGEYGESLCRDLVTYTNGEETGRIPLEEKVTVQPVSRVVARGTGEPEIRDTKPVIGEGRILLPTGETLTYSKVITSLATAYCDKGLTATGTQARVGAIAVDPEVIPYGTRMFIVSKDGEYIYGIATAEDCGSKDHIYDTRIDLHFDTYEECRQFGARYCRVYFLC